MSKNLKLALRSWKPKHHWHIEPNGYVADVFQSLTHIIRTDPIEFFTRVGEQAFFSGNSDNPNAYYKRWQLAEANAIISLNTFIDEAPELTDLSVAHAAITQLPDGWHLHLANSMSVRYANFIGLKPENRNLVYANRGTSGIDGCSSTAVGFALAAGQPTLLLTGDVGFFYDRNAFWQANLPTNLKVVLLNNAGGNIFRMIEGPAQQPELETLFETWQGHSAALTAQQIGCQYLSAHTPAHLEACLAQLWHSDQLTILEVFTDKVQNATTFKAMKSSFKH
jgi:2-succinyl-5-enolpyruvyl-6-hydroxy-3-cyclohexene-1-carboxylate synthase